MEQENFDYCDDQKKVLSILNGKEKTCLMAAPSFVVDFDYLSFVPLMKGLGFDKVSELTFGAKIVNQCYHKYISENKGKQEKFITTVCPAATDLIKERAPDLKKFLLPFDSPMVAMAKILHKELPKHKLVFLAPCSAKKREAKKTKLISAVVTFREMKEIVEKEKPKKVKGLHLFDRFYNDYTKVYPIAGGLSTTLHAKGILKKSEMAQADGYPHFMNVFDKQSEKIFFDVVSCKGGCVGGPGVASGKTLVERKKRVLDYKKFSAGEKIGSRKGLNKYTKGLNFRTTF